LVVGVRADAQIPRTGESRFEPLERSVALRCLFERRLLRQLQQRLLLFCGNRASSVNLFSVEFRRDKFAFEHLIHMHIHMHTQTTLSPASRRRRRADSASANDACLARRRSRTNEYDADGSTPNVSNVRNSMPSNDTAETGLDLLAAMLARVPRVGQKQRAHNKKQNKRSKRKLKVTRCARSLLLCRCVRAACVCDVRGARAGARKRLAWVCLYVVCSSEAGCFLFATTGARFSEP
jgi:hypothetical protein